MSKIKSKGKEAPYKASFIEQIKAFDLLEPLSGEIGTRFRIPPETGKLEEVDVFKSMTWDGIWIYTNPDKDRMCTLYQACHDNMKYIPPRCLECWKVVVRPINLLQLFMLYDLQLKMIEEDPDCWCKCGVEIREYVHANYGGYFYNNSKEDGLVKYKLVRKLVDEQISSDVKVILKRGCTEFEINQGPSDKWDEKFAGNKQAQAWEGLIAEHVVVTNGGYKQSDLVKKHIMSKWIDFAWDRGDPTVIGLNDGKPLFPPPVTYHQTIKEGVKTNGKKSK